MIDIREAFRLMDEMADEKERHHVIHIDAIIATTLDEDFHSENLEDKYDSQTLDEWYDFVMNLENPIGRMCEIVNESHSNNPSSISDFIDFYILDENGDRMNFLVDLRLSDHPATDNDKSIRRRKAEKIDPNNKLLTVTVNNKTNKFETYHDVIEHVKNMILQFKRGETI